MLEEVTKDALDIIIRNYPAPLRKEVDRLFDTTFICYYSADAPPGQEEGPVAFSIHCASCHSYYIAAPMG